MVAALSGQHPKTIGADKGYDSKGFVEFMCCHGVTPHVAQNTNRPGGSTIDQRTTCHKGYAQSINARRGIEKLSVAESLSGAPKNRESPDRIQALWSARWSWLVVQSCGPYQAAP